MLTPEMTCVPTRHDWGANRTQEDTVSAHDAISVQQMWVSKQQEELGPLPVCCKHFQMMQLHGVCCLSSVTSDFFPLASWPGTSP